MHSSSSPGNSVDPPLLRVSRPVTACSRCRRAKKKCDGKLPVCSACNKSGRANECSKDNEKPTKGSERNYVASLESHIEELQEKLSFARGKNASLAINHAVESSETSDCQTTSFTFPTSLCGKIDSRKEAEDMNEVVSGIGNISIKATTQDFESARNGMTFARLVLAATNNKPLPEQPPFKLPPRTATIALITYYIENPFSLFPVFSERQLLNILDRVYRENYPKIPNFDYWLFYMVLAISSTSQSQEEDDGFYMDGVIWVGRALHFADGVLVPGYVSQIQALVLLVQYSMLDPAYFDSWNLIGFVCRAVVDLGFHQDPSKEEEIDQETLELRRIIFYCVYSLDRSISMIHIRSFSFTDDSINVSLPSILPQATSVMTGSQALSRKTNALETALPLFRFRKIQSSWYQELFQSSHNLHQVSSTYIWRMCEEMRKWTESFPENLPASFRDLFDLELFYSYVFIFTFTVGLKAASDYGNKFIFEFSIKYIQKVSSIFGSSINKVFYTYHDALRVYFVSSQFASVLSENGDQLLGSLFSYSPLMEKLFPHPVSELEVDKIDRSLKCTLQIKETLRIFAQRWEDAKVLLSKLEPELDNLARSLHRRKQKTLGTTLGI